MALPQDSWKAFLVAENKEKDALVKCRAVLKKMIDATKVQKNISMDIKGSIPVLVELFDLIQHQKGVKEKLLKTLQPTQQKDGIPEEKRAGSGSWQPSQGGSKGQGSLGPWLKMGGQPSTPPSKRLREDPSSPESEGGSVEDLGWRLQSSKKKKDGRAAFPSRTNLQKAFRKEDTNQVKNRMPRARMEAVVIKPAEGRTYADILQRVRQGVNPAETTIEVRSIRRTQAGEVLMELGKAQEGRQEFQEILKNAVGEMGSVRGLTPRVSIEVRDLDSCTTLEEVELAVRQRLKGKEGVLKTFVTPTNGRELKMAIIELDQLGAKELLETGRVRVGFVNCRVRVRTTVTRCYRCLGYGHQARSCKNEDRSGSCFKCGGAGHKAANCSASEACMLCKELDVDANHVAGRKNCVAFHRALEEASRRHR
ncbi:ZnF_C2HC [Nesidiocoris tenuis]|uniref:ZnF_C2HC n=1 Tax=Nesidiocoris tenuis TaxID=355587 RepID=A0ABN7ADX7_9HEMI|nr:ZnF_C2HC [Nesidiocoris tenuis]BES97487.1 ZnF_C2HC [Nesidiocoris tenuis]